MTLSFENSIDLDSEICKKVCKLLNENLVDTIHLSMQAKLAHWNVKGAQFFPLHELFDKLYDETNDWSDLLAERIVQLGHVAVANLDSVSQNSRLKSYSLKLVDGEEHLSALVHSMKTLCKSIRSSIQQCADLGDDGTADLFTEISRASDKFLWFLESHLITKQDIKK